MFYLCVVGKIVDPAAKIIYTHPMNRHSSTTGMSSLDLLGDIPRGERILLKVFLRNTILSKKEFALLLETLPEKKNISPEEIKEALKALLKREWLRDDGENYTLLQRKHRGSKAKLL